VLLTAALNPRPTLALRLLTWTSPALPIGAWIAGMAAGGAALSAGATALALRGGGADTLRRRTHRDAEPLWEEEERAAPARRWRERDDRAPRPVAAPEFTGRPARAAAGPSREPGQPAPTVSVPFRVLREPAGRSGGEGEAGRDRQRRPREEAVPVPAWDDDWNRDSLDDW